MWGGDVYEGMDTQRITEVYALHCDMGSENGGRIHSQNLHTCF